MGIQARVRRPHAHVCLVNGTDGVFHYASLHGSTAGTDGARTEALGEDLQQWYGVCWQSVNIDRQGEADSGPEDPGFGSGLA